MNVICGRIPTATTKTKTKTKTAETVMIPAGVRVDGRERWCSNQELQLHLLAVFRLSRLVIAIMVVVVVVVAGGDGVGVAYNLQINRL